MTFLIVIIYGVIQGFSEFLPISSSGHLALLPYLLTFKDPGVVFDLCMHVGTALAVVIYFRQRIVLLLQQGIPLITHFNEDHPDKNFLVNFILATVISVVFILIFKPFAGHARSPWVIAFNQAFFGVILWASDFVQRKLHPKSNKGVHYFSSGRRWVDVCIIGASQALAIFPGVSRSGITLTASFMRGIDRREAGAFSFLLSLPIIFAGVAVEIPEIVHSIRNQDQNFLLLLVGVLTSFIVGYLTIHFFMKLISKIHLGWFAAYRILLAIVLCFLLN
ncbi:MAG: undecaprenyl-diphosphate phosphatase [Bacteriovoracaceae bacterium]|nr:undecaprenyl-diphosphate phosphatase [Bacteriovoracaceae bacterium]